MTEAILAATHVCEHCKAYNDEGRKYCSQCSFPIEGTEEEKRSFRLTVSSRKRFLDDARSKIRYAKIVICGLAGLFFLVGMFQGFASDDFVSMIANLFLCVLYLLLAAWCNHNPLGAILTAFIIYLTLMLVNLLIDPITLFQGVIIKCIVIAGFVKGIRSAQEAKGYLRELQNLKADPFDYQ